MDGFPLRAAAGVLALLLAPTAASAAPGDVTTIAGSAGSGPATAIGMVPTGVVASGDRLIAGDATNGTVRVVDLGSGVARPLAGIGAAGFGADGLDALRTALPGTGNGFVGPQELGVAALTVSDPGGTGRLVNGSFALAQPLRIDGVPLPATVRTYAGPVSGDVSDIRFTQAIGAGEPLRTGAYANALVFTLSTTAP